jgi:hypothetical protein
MRLVGERRALAALALAFFTLQFLLTAIFDDRVGELRAALAALGIAYGCGFVGVVAGWFWARWYSLGLAFSGLAMACIAAWQAGGFFLDLYILGGAHAVLGIGLLGAHAAEFYDGRRDWRERWKLDDAGVNRLGKAIMRAGASLPYLIVVGLVPRDSLGGEALGLLALAMGTAGLVGIVRLRTWAIFAFAFSALVSLGALGGVSAGVPPWLISAPAAAAALLAAAAAPFVRPLWQHLTRD